MALELNVSLLRNPNMKSKIQLGFKYCVFLKIRFSDKPTNQQPNNPGQPASLKSPKEVREGNIYKRKVVSLSEEVLKY